MPSGTTSKRLRLPAHQAKAHQRLMEKLRSPAASEEVSGQPSKRASTRNTANSPSTTARAERKPASRRSATSTQGVLPETRRRGEFSSGGPCRLRSANRGRSGAPRNERGTPDRHPQVPSVDRGPTWTETSLAIRGRLMPPFLRARNRTRRSLAGEVQIVAGVVDSQGPLPFRPLDIAKGPHALRLRALRFAVALRSRGR